MNRKMSIRGVAPQIAIPTLVYLLISFIISSLMKSSFRIRYDPLPLTVIGIIWIVPGIIMVAATGRMIVKSFNENTLLRSGLYRVFRNPMYAAYFLFIIPGICLLFNSWLVMTTVPVNYVLFQIFVHREYIYLREKFGKEYDDYVKTMLIKFL